MMDNGETGTDCGGGGCGGCDTGTGTGAPDNTGSQEAANQYQELNEFGMMCPTEMAACLEDPVCVAGMCLDTVDETACAAA